MKGKVLDVTLALGGGQGSWAHKFILAGLSHSDGNTDFQWTVISVIILKNTLNIVMTLVPGHTSSSWQDGRDRLPVNSDISYNTENDIENSDARYKQVPCHHGLDRDYLGDLGECGEEEVVGVHRGHRTVTPSTAPPSLWEEDGEDSGGQNQRKRRNRRNMWILQCL